jgi:hypothetical protein
VSWLALVHPPDDDFRTGAVLLRPFVRGVAIGESAFNAGVHKPRDVIDREAAVELVPDFNPSAAWSPLSAGGQMVLRPSFRQFRSR